MATINLQRVTLPDGRKVEFLYQLETYYGGKWHKKRGLSYFPFPLPLTGNFHHSYDGKIFRVKSWNAVYVSRYGYANRVDFGRTFLSGNDHAIFVSAENVQQLHELFTQADRCDLIPVLLRYLGEASTNEGGVKYVL